MILYLVHGNTYFNSYGYEEHLFGIYQPKMLQKMLEICSLTSFIYKKWLIVTQQ